MNSAISLFTAGGANMSKVQFIIKPINAIWMRDYGPHFIWQDGALGIIDSNYYPQRPLDNFIPTLLGDDIFKMPTYDIGLYYSGGNFQPGPNRTAFMSNLVNVDNPASEGFNQTLIAEMFQTYQGIDTLHVLPQLPGSVDGTGHIDMWMYLIKLQRRIKSPSDEYHRKRSPLHGKPWIHRLPHTSMERKLPFLWNDPLDLHQCIPCK
jgi:hypothetical protein